MYCCGCTVSGVVVVVCLVVLHGLLVVHNVPGAELGSENKPVQFVITEAEFLDVVGTKVLLAIHSHLYKRILPPPLEKKWFETGL